MAASIQALVCLLALCGLPATAASAAPRASLHVSLSPERPGQGTTISFGFTISETGRSLPPALTTLDVSMPPGMGVDLRGVSTCTPRKLLERGLEGCPVDARVGAGSVDVRVPLGNVTRSEKAALTVFNAPRRGGHAALAFYAAGRLPIATRLVFSGVIAPHASAETIAATIPLIPTLPEAPDAAIVSMSSTIGTRQRVYYRTLGHRRIRVTPKGATLPATCPAGGFPFRASFSFNDSATATALATVGCAA
jgi:hypothetical protein